MGREKAAEHVEEWELVRTFPRKHVQAIPEFPGFNLV